MSTGWSRKGLQWITPWSVSRPAVTSYYVNLYHVYNLYDTVCILCILFICMCMYISIYIYLCACGASTVWAK
jgi:hypothetical protein